MGGMNFLDEINKGTTAEAMKSIDEIMRDLFTEHWLAPITIGEPLPELKNGHCMVVKSYDNHYHVKLHRYQDKTNIHLHGGKDDSEEQAFAEMVKEQYLLDGQIIRLMSFEPAYDRAGELQEQNAVMLKDIDWLTSGWRVGTVVDLNTLKRMAEIRKKYGLD